MTRKKLIVGNWKMNMTVHEASLFVHRLAERAKQHRDVEVVLAPGMLILQPLSLQIHRAHFKLSSQNLYWRDSGAYTGEVSAAQLHGLVDYAIIGHSERRHIFNERDKEIRYKVQAAIRNDIQPILCIGENLEQRNKKITKQVIENQLKNCLKNIKNNQMLKVSIAYEPVWAISRGNPNTKPASAQDAEDIHKFIRSLIKDIFGKNTAVNTRIIYGGSIKPDNAKELMAMPNIDGGLVGNASLNAKSFAEIVNSAI